MKTGKTSAAILGLIGGMAIGIWIGAEMTSDRESASGPVAAVQPAEAPAPEPVKTTPRRVARASRLTVATAAGNGPAVRQSW